MSVHQISNECPTLHTYLLPKYLSRTFILRRTNVRLDMGEKRRLERDNHVAGSNGSSKSRKRQKNSDGNHQSTRSIPSKTNPHLPNVPSAFPSSKPSRTQTFPSLPPISNELLRKAVFVHPSTRSHKDASARDDSMTYEQLEFLGDAYIELIATRLIHVRFPNFNVGERAQTRESLVKNETLANFSRLYGFDEPGVIKVNGHERETGGKHWIKILGDVLEAYVAAVIESDPSNGFQVVEEWLTALWEPQLSKFAAKAGESPRVNVGELKDKLQTLLMNPRAGVKIKFVDTVPPRLDRASGKTWTVKEVRLTGWGYEDKTLGRGENTNGKVAEAMAIQDALDKNMDLIMEANAMKKEFERKLKESQEAAAQVEEGI